MLVFPGRNASAAALVLLGPAAAVATLAGYADGSLALLGVLVGVMAGIPAAVTTIGAGDRAVLVILAAASAAGGLLAQGDALAVALAVAAAALAQLASSRRAAGLGAMLPVVAAVAASVPLPAEPVRFAVWVAVGVATVIVAGELLPAAVEAVPIDGRVAVRHAVAAAAGTGAAAGLSTALEVTHGYWVVLVIAQVLRPVRGQTSAHSRDRTLGTVVGLALAIGLILVVPTPVAVAVAAVLTFLGVGWALRGDVARQTALATPSVVLLASSGVVGDQLGIALERLLLTVAGAGVAVLIAHLLARTDPVDVQSR